MWASLLGRFWWFVHYDSWPVRISNQHLWWCLWWSTLFALRHGLLGLHCVLQGRSRCQHLNVLLGFLWNSGICLLWRLRAWLAQRFIINILDFLSDILFDSLGMSSAYVEKLLLQFHQRLCHLCILPDHSCYFTVLIFWFKDQSVAALNLMCFVQVLGIQIRWETKLDASSPI